MRRLEFLGDGREVWEFVSGSEDENFAAAEATLAAARTKATLAPREAIDE